MGNAYELKEEWTADGKKLLRRELTLGPITVWGLIAIVAILKGQTLASWPTSFWNIFHR